MNSIHISNKKDISKHIENGIKQLENEIYQYRELIIKKINPYSFWRKLLKQVPDDAQLEEMIDDSYWYLFSRLSLESELEELKSLYDAIELNHDIIIDLATYNKIKNY